MQSCVQLVWFEMISWKAPTKKTQVPQRLGIDVQHTRPITERRKAYVLKLPGRRPRIDLIGVYSASKRDHGASVAHGHCVKPLSRTLSSDRLGLLPPLHTPWRDQLCSTACSASLLSACELALLRAMHVDYAWPEPITEL
eukprot:2619531-Rhodomonas_salina.2